ncbi:MAG: cupin domain-containing protein [Christensenellales bacterium]|jgi:quercetin dioxygenase-like cupin family protein
MYIQHDQMQVQQREHLRGGNGITDFLHIVPSEELPAKSRLFSQMSLEKGCSVGRHEHLGETEIYYVLQGEGALDDNGILRPFRKGDCNVCKGGKYHAVSNEKDETLIILAVIILD